MRFPDNSLNGIWIHFGAIPNYFGCFKQHNIYFYIYQHFFFFLSGDGIIAKDFHDRKCRGANKSRICFIICGENTNFLIFKLIGMFFYCFHDFGINNIPHLYDLAPYNNRLRIYCFNNIGYSYAKITSGFL